ncbi:uncharacterized protein LOC124172665 [Ischnura elegans]|uniref:uncharacterized protein LOC124172665 n=1 Tax=Ischnura elegans TaxID=197161 RepID=UPI001ED86FF7|nr:uncharacterized protein LOC124172665 [Ischnura elegans]XP_046408077.1 uncharacterized protein LOC124172665 [Ischnura elegans]
MDGEDEMAALCRICQEPSNMAKDLFAGQRSGKLTYEIINDIYQLGILPDDGLLRYICNKCHQTTLKFYRFKRCAETALECLQKISDPSQKGIKLEPDEEITVEGEDVVKERRKTTNSLCRLCANVSRFYRNIFMQKHHGLPVYHIINELLSFKVAPGDDFPAWVCQACLTTLIDFYKSKRLALYKSSSLPQPPSSDTNAVAETKPLVKVRSQESMMERMVNHESDKSPRKVPAPVRHPAVDSSEPSTSQRASPPQVGVVGAISGGVEDKEDLDDYLEWMEYVEFTDFIDSFPLPNCDDVPGLDAVVLQGMQEALSSRGSKESMMQSALRAQQRALVHRMQSLKSTQTNQKRLHELRMMRLKADIALKEQKVRHMRDMMTMRRKIMDSKEEIRKIKAKTQELNAWRQSLERSKGSSSTGDVSASSPVAPANIRSQTSVSLTPHSPAPGESSDVSSAEKVAVKEEPKEDYIGETEVRIKDEPMSDNEEANSESVGADSMVMNVIPMIEVTPDIKIEMDTSADAERPSCSEGDKEASSTEAKRNSPEYPTETLRLAVEAVARHGCSVHMAASRYEIPLGMLKNYLNIGEASGYLRSISRSESDRELTLSVEGEERLAKFVSEMKQRGFALHKDTVEQVANVFLEEELSVPPINLPNDDQPCVSSQWVSSFCTRHSSNLCNKPDTTRLPAGLQESTLLVDFYDIIKLIYRRLGIVVAPHQVWNCDEATLCLAKQDGRVVSKAGRRYYCEDVGCTEVMLSTVLCSVSAAGKIGPCIFLTKEKCTKSPLVPQNLMVETTNSGRLDHKVFRKWFGKFVAEVRVKKPILLVIEAKNNYLSPEVVDLAMEKGVVFVPIHFSASGSPHPVLRSVLRSLMDSWGKYLSVFQNGDATVVPWHSHVLYWFLSALREADNMDSIVAGFCKAMIYPPHRWVLERPKAAGYERAKGAEEEESRTFEGTSFEQRLKELMKSLYTEKQS